MDPLKPLVVVSKCLTFDHCRYNGHMISDPFIEKMKPFVDFVPVCPEMAIHLGVPRNPIRLIFENEQFQLVQPATGKTLTTEMKTFLERWLTRLDGVDGFLLKSRSPSCGIKDVKVYPSMESKSALKKAKGYFGMQIDQFYPYLIMEDEGRLSNAHIREHFLARLYLQAGFRKLKKNYSVAHLIDFHTRNKYLFMAYHQSGLKKMGVLVANAKRLNEKQVLEDYQTLIQTMFSKLPRTGSMINALLHCFGYVSDKLNTDERSYFLDLIQQYKEKHVPLSVLLSLMKSWIVRFKEPYLAQQTLFSPYPMQLLDLSDSGKNE